MSPEFKFKLSTSASSTAQDAETLFRDLKNRDPQIQHLWAHQADIIRSYHKAQDKSDVALELPTGTGKTLVGLLLAEWRRISMKQRVAYLCPTRQLAHQVGEKAIQYGIKAHVLVGPQTEYPPGHIADYGSADAIAVTTYSGLFNSNPRIDNPETIVLDDAHAGENYIASMWSLTVSRFYDSSLYDALVDLFTSNIPDYLVSILKDDNPSPLHKQSVELIPSPYVFKKEKELTDLLDKRTDGTNLFYSWMLLRGKLGACHLFVSWAEILLRPWIPVSLTHQPFAAAKQRIYMSATIGAGGELERITGVPSIDRIPVPLGWDRQSTGRRLFVFPDRSFNSNDYDEWLIEAIKASKRTLVLTPNGLRLDSFTQTITELGLEHSLLSAREVEESLDPFITSSKSILALTNRYDGIDLPGEACRLLVVYGLPASVNLQERFLWSKLALSRVLRDRIRTRITQAVGRCTRNPTDYAAVLMVGEDLFDFCIKRENRAELHPELRAEIEFGLDNSEQKDLSSLGDLVEVFLLRHPSWSKAEEDIAKRRDDTVSPPLEYLYTLRDIVATEVEYQYDLWKDDYNAALTRAAGIVDQLSGDDLAGYRALWNYFAGCSAYRLGTLKNDDRLIHVAKNRFGRASKAVQGSSWFARLTFGLEEKEDATSRSSFLNVSAAEFIEAYLIGVGLAGPKFERMLKENEGLIKDKDPGRFDRALSQLGRMAGFDAERPEGKAAPDSVWRIAGEYVLLFEAKSDETPNDEISISTCRQAQGHIAWLAARPFFTQNAKVISILVSPRKRIDKDAIPHSKGLFYVNIDEIRALHAEVAAFLREARSKLPDVESEQRRQLIQDALKESDLEPERLVARLTQRPLSHLPT
jgi:hypothetical protein